MYILYFPLLTNDLQLLEGSGQSSSSMFPAFMGRPNYKFCDAGYVWATLIAVSKPARVVWGRGRYHATNITNGSHCLMLGCAVRRVRVGVRSQRNVTRGGLNYCCDFGRGRKAPGEGAGLWGRGVLTDNEWETLHFHRCAFDGLSSVSSLLNLFDKIISIFAQTQ